MSHAETLPRAANAACAITSSLVFAVPLLALASVRECHPNTGKHGAALVVMWAGDLPNDA
jgi:hypothetical protein